MTFDAYLKLFGNKADEQPITDRCSKNPYRTSFSLGEEHGVRNVKNLECEKNKSKNVSETFIIERINN